VVVIDDADDLNPESANCFLKTLEEPPPRAVLILIGTRPERQLPTIVSRCQVVRFVPLPDEVVRALIEEHGISDHAFADRLVRLAGGSPGTALSLADPALWEFRETLLTSISQPHFDFIELGKIWIDFVESAGKESAPRRRRAKLVFRLLIDFLSDALAQTVSAPPRYTDSARRATLEAFAHRLSPERVMDYLERSFEAERQIDRNVPLALVVESFLDTFVQVA
jgi:DNA polymerase-3 subunit delta'